MTSYFWQGSQWALPLDFATQVAARRADLATELDADPVNCPSPASPFDDDGDRASSLQLLFDWDGCPYHLNRFSPHYLRRLFLPRLCAKQSIMQR